MVSKREVLDWPNPYESRSSSSKTYSGYGRFCQGKSGSNTPLVGPFQVSKKWNKYFVILFSVKPILLSWDACWQKFKRENGNKSNWRDYGRREVHIDTPFDKFIRKCITLYLYLLITLNFFQPSIFPNYLDPVSDFELLRELVTN